MDRKRQVGPCGVTAGDRLVWRSSYTGEIQKGRTRFGMEMCDR